MEPVFVEVVSEETDARLTHECFLRRNLNVALAKPVEYQASTSAWSSSSVYTHTLSQNVVTSSEALHPWTVVLAPKDAIDERLDDLRGDADPHGQHVPFPGDEGRALFRALGEDELVESSLEVQRGESGGTSHATEEVLRRVVHGCGYISMRLLSCR